MPKEKNMQNLPFELVENGIRLRVRLTPKARENALKGLQPDAEGRLSLKASVTAVPEDGKANEALIKLLSKELRLAKSSIEVIAGASDRNKILLLTGDSRALQDILTGYFLANEISEKE